MNTIEWAKAELDLAGYSSDSEDGPNKWMRDNVLELLDVFAAQGHSGFSATYAVSIFHELANHRPLTPLTGEDEEWVEVGDGMFQNRRCSCVFKSDSDGAYNIDGIVFWEWWEDPETGEQSKVYFTNVDSRVPVTFPYTVPKEPEYREAPTTAAMKGGA